MSTTERYGTLVWEALLRLHARVSAGVWEWHSVGEISIEAGVSRPTTRKYLMMLSEMGNVRVISGNNFTYYQPILHDGE